MKRWSFAVAFVASLLLPATGFAQDAIFCVASGEVAQCEGDDCKPADALGEASSNDEEEAKHRALANCFDHMSQLVSEAEVSTMYRGCYVSMCESRTADAN